jgi:Domain of unknown function (DUF5050)/Abnormal spindle-like microcephaly-assoc'd, ASPM-SPD-2-Hydin
LGAGAPPAPASLAFTPTTSAGTYDFGTLAVGATASQTFTLKNSGGTATGALTVSLTGSAAFTKAADGCTAISLGAGKSCTVTVQYSPSATGASDTAQLTATNGKRKQPTTANLALAGAGALSGHIYWVNGNYAIARANRDGSNPNLTFIGGDGSFFDAIDVEVDSNYIYWTYANSFTSAIARASLDGTNQNLTFIPGVHSAHVAVDSNYIYWADLNFGTIGRANLDGSNPNYAFITTGSNFLSGVEVDSNYIYWTNNNISGTIGRANLDGSNPNLTFITGANFPLGVTVDSNYIYWANSTNAPNAIGRANLDGSNPNQS